MGVVKGEPDPALKMAVAIIHVPMDTPSSFRWTWFMAKSTFWLATNFGTGRMTGGDGHLWRLSTRLHRPMDRPNLIQVRFLERCSFPNAGYSLVIQPFHQVATLQTAHLKGLLGRPAVAHFSMVT